jgi:hypothetical protein
MLTGLKREHAETRDRVRFPGDPGERIGPAHALHARGGAVLDGRVGAALHDGRIGAALHGRALLDGVRELVGDELAPGRRVGLVLPLAEDDVVPHGVCMGRHVGAALGGGVARMHAHVAEVGVEARLHEVAHGRG